VRQEGFSKRRAAKPPTEPSVPEHTNEHESESPINVWNPCSEMSVRTNFANQGTQTLEIVHRNAMLVEDSLRRSAHIFLCCGKLRDHDQSDRVELNTDEGVYPSN
jgi:hypothetical protein